MPLTRQQKAYKANLPPLSPQHRDALYGMLLGDACATRCRGCIQFDQSAKQAAFVDHLFQFFRDWTWYDQPQSMVRVRVARTMVEKVKS